MKPAELLMQWVKLKYEGQLIKRTTEPLFNHLSAVAEMAAKGTAMGYETGLCHDLFEDTDVTPNELKETLTSFGYNDAAAAYIITCVMELTDVFTAKSFPDLSKAERKEREAARLATISPGAQTVKYCDLIYNINWMLAYDQKHAERYLKKKLLLLYNMVNGDQEIRQQALDLVYKSLDSMS